MLNDVLAASLRMVGVGRAVTRRCASRCSEAAALLLILAVSACSTAPSSPAPEPDPGLYGRPTAADPWGHYIRAASIRFDVPEIYVRSVMQIESGGRTHLNGRPITSRAGARGLMQIMPATFEELRRKHNLGSDPYDPWTNILAGTAYIREMYELYGAPGFLAAYNCGPGCYGDFLAGRRSLPSETRNYLAMGSRLIDGARPPVYAALDAVPSAPVPTPARPAANPVAAPLSAPLAAPALPVAVAPVAVATVVASQIAGAPIVWTPVAGTPVAGALVLAAPALTGRAAGIWGVQVGAFSTPSASSQAAERARRLSPALHNAEVTISEVSTSAGLLYRARLIGLDEAGASDACRRLASQGAACVLVRDS